MNAEEVLQLAVELSGLGRVPEDAAVHVPGGPLRRVLFGLDVGPAELLLARELGLDGCVAHPPSREPGSLEGVPRVRAQPSVTYTTRRISSMVVTPSSTFWTPSSRMVRKPSDRAASRTSLAGARRTTSSRMRSVTTRSS